MAELSDNEVRDCVHRLVELLPLVQATEASPIYERTESLERTGPNSFNIVGVQYIPSVYSIFQELAENQILESVEGDYKAANIVYQRDDDFSSASFNEMLNLLKVFVRKERFCEGTWGHLLESKKMSLVIQRIIELFKFETVNATRYGSSAH